MSPVDLSCPGVEPSKREIEIASRSATQFQLQAKMREHTFRLRNAFDCSRGGIPPNMGPGWLQLRQLDAVRAGLTLPPRQCDAEWVQSRKNCSFAFVRRQAPTSHGRAMEAALGQHRRPSDVHCDALSFVLLGPDGRIVETIHDKCEMLSLHAHALYWRGDGRHHTVLFAPFVQMHVEEGELELTGCLDGLPSWNYSEEPVGCVGPSEEDVTKWIADSRVRVLHNLQKLRRRVKLAGRFVCLLRRATERCYAPGGNGFKRVRDEFEGLAEGVGPSDPMAEGARVLKNRKTL